MEDLNNTPKRSEATKAHKMVEWVQNSYLNYRYMSRPDIGTIKEHIGEFEGQDIIVVGSGYTLDLAIPHLIRLNRRIDIVTCPTQVSTINFALGRMPDYVICFDSHVVNYDNLSLDRLDYSNTVLWTNPTFTPKVVKKWGEDYDYRNLWTYLPLPYMHHSMDAPPGTTWGQFVEKYQPKNDDQASMYLRDAHSMFSRHVLPMAYQNIGFGVMSTADSTAQAMVVASLLGYKRIFLVGVDHGFVDGFMSCSKWEVFDDAWVLKKPKRAAGADILMSENGIKTTEQLIAYKMSQLGVARGIEGEIWEITIDDKFGIDDFFPRLPIESLISGNIPEYKESKEERAKRATQWLRDHLQAL